MPSKNRSHRAPPGNGIDEIDQVPSSSGTVQNSIMHQQEASGSGSQLSVPSTSLYSASVPESDEVEPVEFQDPVVENEHADLDPSLTSVPSPDDPKIPELFPAEPRPPAGSLPVKHIPWPFSPSLWVPNRGNYQASYASEGPSRGPTSASPSSTVGAAHSARIGSSMTSSPWSPSNTLTGGDDLDAVGARSPGADKWPAKDDAPQPVSGVFDQLERARPDPDDDVARIRPNSLLFHDVEMADEEVVPMHDEVAREGSPKFAPPSADNGHAASVGSPKNVPEFVQGSQDAPDADAMFGVESTHEDDRMSTDEDQVPRSPLFTPDASMSIDDDEDEEDNGAPFQLALPDNGEPWRHPSQVLAEALAREAENAENAERGADDDMDDQPFFDAVDSPPQEDDIPPPLHSDESSIADDGEFYDADFEGYDSSMSSSADAASSPSDNMRPSPQASSSSDDERPSPEAPPSPDDALPSPTASSDTLVASSDSADDVTLVNSSTDSTSSSDSTPQSSQDDPDSSFDGSNGGPLGDQDEDAEGSTDDGEWEEPDLGSEDAEGETDDGIDDEADYEMADSIDVPEATFNHESSRFPTQYPRAGTVDSGFEEFDLYEVNLPAQDVPKSDSKVNEGVDDSSSHPPSAAAGNENVSDRPSTPVRHGNDTYEYQYHLHSETTRSNTPFLSPPQGLSPVRSTQGPSPVRKSPHALRKPRSSLERRAPLVPTQGRPGTPTFRDGDCLSEDVCSSPPGYAKHHPKEHRADENQPVLPRTH